MKTRLSICAKKARFVSAADARRIAAAADVALRPYRCDRCGMFHLTSRTKGKRVARPEFEARRQSRLAAAELEAGGRAFVDALSKF